MVSIKVQRITGTFIRMSIQDVNHFQVYFCRKRSFFFFFFSRWAQHRVCNAYIQKIQFFYVFFEKDDLLFSFQRKNIMFLKKNTIFPDNTRKIMFQRNLFEKTISSGHLNKISYFHVFFFQKDHLSFSVQGIRSYFREKEMPSFPILQERSYFSAVFFGKTIFL